MPRNHGKPFVTIYENSWEPTYHMFMEMFSIFRSHILFLTLKLSNSNVQCTLGIIQDGGQQKTDKC